MEYFTLHRLQLKNRGLDRFDFLDKHWITPQILMSPLSLINREENKQSILINHLFLEWISSQRVKQSVTGKHFSKTTALTTLRKDKLLRLFDSCLNSKFLTDKAYLDKTTNFFESSLVLDTTLVNILCLSKALKLLPRKEIKVLVSCKLSCSFTHYLR